MENTSRSKALGAHLFLSRTKKQYVWKFEVDGVTATVELFTSMLSGKKKIRKNGVVLIETKQYAYAPSNNT